MSNRAFFSYARADAKLANWLWRQLDSYRTPKDLVGIEGKLGPVPDRLHKVFRDRDDLSAGRHLNEALQVELENSERLVVLCTPTSANSKWVNHEVETFLRLAREDRIFPVIGAGEPDSGDPETECFPPALRGRGLLAADLREIKQPNGHIIGDGRDGGRLKLIAGLLGIDLDQLVKRERQRQRHQFLLVSAAALVFAGLAAIAVFQTAVIERSERRAQEQTIVAKNERNRAINSLGQVAADEAWRALEGQNTNSAIRFAMAGATLAPNLKGEFRDLLAAAALDPAPPIILGSIVSRDLEGVVAISPDKRDVVLLTQPDVWELWFLRVNISTGVTTKIHDIEDQDYSGLSYRNDWREAISAVSNGKISPPNRIECAEDREARRRGARPNICVLAQNWLVEGDGVGWVYVYERSSKKLLAERRIHSGAVQFLQVIGNEVVSFGEDGRIVSWSPRDAQPIVHFVDQRGTGSVWGDDIEWSSDGNFVLYSGGGQTSIFDPVTGALISELSVKSQSLSNKFASVAGGGFVMWTPSSLEMRQTNRSRSIRIEGSKGEWGFPTSSKNGRYFAAIEKQEGLVIWGADGTRVRTMSNLRSVGAFGLNDQGQVVAALDDGRVSIDGEILSWLKPSLPFVSVKIDRNTLLLGDGAGRLVCIDLDKERLIWEEKAHWGSISAIDLALAEGIAATAGLDGKVRLWSLNTGNELADRDLAGGAFPISGLAFSPDGHSLAIAREDNAAEVWNVRALGYGWEQLRSWACSTEIHTDQRMFTSEELSRSKYLLDIFGADRLEGDVCSLPRQIN